MLVCSYYIYPLYPIEDTADTDVTEESPTTVVNEVTQEPTASPSVECGE